MNKKQISIILGAVCAVLVFAIFVQLKTIESTTSTVSQTFSENKLRDEVLKNQEKCDQLLEAVENEENNLELIRKQVAEDDNDAAKIEEELKKAYALIGLTDLTGQGVIITLDDNKTASLETIGIDTDISYFLVHSSDLLQVVNELWNAGAEAISINGERVIATTDFANIDYRYIYVNGKERITSPYVVKAIGDQNYLESGLNAKQYGYIDNMTKALGKTVTLERENNIKIGKYEGEIALENITE